MSKLAKHILPLLLVSFGFYAFGISDSDYQEPNKDDPPIQEEINISLIYPNPVQNTLFLDPAVLDRYSLLSIYNQSGSLILEHELNESNSLDVNTLTPGMYIVQFEGSECMLSVVMFKK